MADANTLKIKTDDGVDNKYGKLDRSLVALLRNYEVEYFREDKPVPFCGLKIYPVKVRNFEEFSNCCSCLTLNKNETIEGVRMSHLDFLVSKMQSKEDVGEGWSYKLQRLFELIFHIDNGMKCIDCGHIIKYSDKEFIDFVQKMRTLQMQVQEQGEAGLDPSQLPELVCPKCGKNHFTEMIKLKQDEKTKKYSMIVDGKTITKNDYANLRQIVLFQNYPDYVDDSWVDPDLKRDYQARKEIERKNNDVHASIEKKVTCLSITTSYKFDEIYDMSIRRFTMALATVDDLINYKIMRQAVMSGFISLPKGKKIEHWIYKPDKDMYGDGYRDVEGLKNSINSL